jgi:hypothetical protein
VSKKMLGASAILIAFHPLTMACHYGLFRKKRPTNADGDYKYAAWEEILILLLSLICAVVAATASG